MNKNKLLLAAMLGLTSVDLIHAPPSRGTVSNPRRFRHQSEIEKERMETKRRDIAEWNNRLKDKP